MKKIIFMIMLIFCSFVIKTQETGPEKRDGIYPYKPEHETKIKPIAMEHLHKLASRSGYADQLEYREFIYNWQIAGALKHSIAKVFLEDNEPVGFITYDMWEPWHRKWINSELGPNAKIHHVAVATKHQSKGYKSALMDHAMQEFRNNQVNRATLWITASNNELDRFYSRYGFRVVHCSRACSAERYIAQIGPHPLLAFFRKIIRR